VILVKGSDGRVWHSGATEPLPPHQRRKAPCGMSMKDPVTFRDSNLIDSTELCSFVQCVVQRHRME
jgi:hypothetical protein